MHSVKKIELHYREMSLMCVASKNASLTVHPGSLIIDYWASVDPEQSIQLIEKNPSADLKMGRFQLLVNVCAF